MWVLGIKTSGDISLLEGSCLTELSLAFQVEVFQANIINSLKLIYLLTNIVLAGEAGSPFFILPFHASLFLHRNGKGLLLPVSKTERNAVCAQNKMKIPGLLVPLELLWHRSFVANKKDFASLIQSKERN